MSLEYLDDEWKWAFDTLVYIKFLATISFNIFTVWWHIKKKTISTLKALLKTVSYNLFLGTQKVFKVSQNEKVRLLRLIVHLLENYIGNTLQRVYASQSKFITNYFAKWKEKFNTQLKISVFQKSCLKCTSLGYFGKQ